MGWQHILWPSTFQDNQRVQGLQSHLVSTSETILEITLLDAQMGHRSSACEPMKSRLSRMLLVYIICQINILHFDYPNSHKSRSHQCTQCKLRTHLHLEPPKKISRQQSLHEIIINLFFLHERGKAFAIYTAFFKISELTVAKKHTSQCFLFLEINK